MSHKISSPFQQGLHLIFRAAPVGSAAIKAVPFGTDDEKILTMRVIFLSGMVGTYRATKIFAAAAFQTVEEIEFAIAWLKYVCTGKERRVTNF